MSPPPTRSRPPDLAAGRLADRVGERHRSVVEQAAAGGLDLVEHRLEAVRAAVVRVGHVEVGRAGARRVELAQQPRLAGRVAVGRERAQLAQVLAVHRQQQVEVLEVARADLARRALERHAARARPPRSRGGRAGRRRATSRCPRCRSRTRARARPRARGARMTALRRRRAADVAHADEEDPVSSRRSMLGGRPPSWATACAASRDAGGQRGLAGRPARRSGSRRRTRRRRRSCRSRRRPARASVVTRPAPVAPARAVARRA